MDDESLRHLVLKCASENSTVAQVKFINDDPDGIKVKLLEGGVVNYVLLVESSDRQSSVVLKHGKETFRVAIGEVTPISLKRQAIEYNALDLAHKIAPGSVAEPYCLDTKNNIIIMENLSSLKEWGKELRQGVIDIRHAEKLGEMFAKIHEGSRQENITPEHWQQLQQKFGDLEISNMLMSYRLVNPFIETDSYNAIPEQCLSTYRKCLSTLHQLDIVPRLTNRYQASVCLTNTDAHINSIFVTEGRVAVIDWEFCRLGNPVLDIWFIVLSYIFTMIEARDLEHVNTEDNRSQTRKALKCLVGKYLDVATTLKENAKLRTVFLTELVLFTGTFSFAVVHFVHLDGYFLLNPQARNLLMENGIKAVEYAVANEIETIEELLDVLLKDL